MTLFLAVALFAISLRAHLIAIPLERDEGEYACAGMLILQGYQPYADIYNMIMPGIYGAYALLISLFGATPSGIHFGLLIINLATLPLLYLIGKRLFDDWAGFTAAAAYALFSSLQSVQGVIANAEHFVVLFALGGILLLMKAIDEEKNVLFLGSGLLLGLAYMMKQHGVFFSAFAGFYLLIREWRKQPLDPARAFRRVMLFVLGAAAPFVFTCLFSLMAGSFRAFWFWTYQYGREYVSMMSPADGWRYFKLNAVPIVLSAPLLWVLAAMGLTALYWNDDARSRRLFLTLFLIFSFLSLVPGFYFRPHYFIFLLPALSLLAGVAVHAVRSLLLKKSVLVRNAVPAVMVLICLLFSAYQNREFLFAIQPVEASRVLYGSNPFPESVVIGKYIRDRSSKKDRIAVIGSEPQIYFYAGRNPATRYIYVYPLMEKHPFSLQMQREMAGEIESSHPKFLVYVNVKESWCAEKDSPRFIFDWFEAFRERHYTRVGIVDISDKGISRYYWDESSKDYTPRSREWIAVYKRKG